MKAKFTFLILLLEMIGFNAYSQHYATYNRLCNEAEVQIREGNLLIAQGMLGHAFTLVPKPRAIDYFNLAKCYSQAEQPDSTLKYIELALQNNDRIRSFVKNHYLWFQPLLGVDKWEALLEKMQQSSVRAMTFEEEKILAVYLRMDSISDIYPKYLRDSLYTKFPRDSALIKVYHDSVYLKSMEASAIFDSLCTANGQIPDSHPYFEYRTFFSCRNFPLEWFDKNQAFLEHELHLGRFLPGEFVDYLLEKEYIQNGILPYSYFFSNEITDQKIEFSNKYGYSFDLDTRKLREYILWPYD